MAQHAYPIQLKRIATVVPGIFDLQLPFPKREALDATDMDSPNSHREFIGGLIDPGQVVAQLHWLPSNTVLLALRADILAGNLIAFEVEYPDGSKANFSALVLSLEPTGSVEDKQVATLTLQVSGEYTFTDV